MVGCWMAAGRVGGDVSMSLVDNRWFCLALFSLALALVGPGSRLSASTMF
jgi:hypothetical protein